MTFPVDLSETQSFSLGRPVKFTISPDGQRVVFLRSRGGRDPVRCLWQLDVASGEERLIADPAVVAGGDLSIPAAERAQRERLRDQSQGISSYATDAAVAHATFSVAGRLYRADLATGVTQELPASSPALDPRLDPTGQVVAYVHDGALHLVQDGADRIVAAPDGPDVTWGLPEHVASESMARMRGYWWSPDGQWLAVARVDNAPVQTWYLFNQDQPDQPPIAQKYPMAGTTNAEVSLWVIGLDGEKLAVLWDRREFEYLVEVAWDAHGLMIMVQNRAQTVVRVLAVDLATGATSLLQESTDADWWVIIPGVPARTAAGELIWTLDEPDTRRLTVGGEPVTPSGLQVHEVLTVDGDTVVFAASAEASEWHVWSWSRAEGLVPLTTEPGIHDGYRGGGTTVISRYCLAESDAPITVTAGDRTLTITSLAEQPSLQPKVDLFRAGERDLQIAVLLPTGHVPGSRKLPVLMDPYGGPFALRAVSAQYSYRASQWFADQGFLVVVADGRGTPGRGPAWEHVIKGHEGEHVLTDQIDALHAVAERYPDADLSRVGIRGWSYGGYLSAMAVLRRPDVFHAAISGAPVTDRRLYDTHWIERFFGHPDTNKEEYDRGSLLPDAPNLRRPLLLIHGLMDDNVHPVNTTRLSAALLAAGKQHSFLPLPSGSHMGSAELAAQLLVYQATYLMDALSPVREI